MSQKRDFSDLEDGEVSDPEPPPASKSKSQLEPEQQQQPEPKRLRTTSTHQRHQHAGIDATWGQKSVFSSGGSHRGATTIPDGLEDDFEDDSDAMAYLMAVRQEAHAIPHLLRAPEFGPQLPASFARPPRNRNEGGNGSGQDYDDDGSGRITADDSIYEGSESPEDDPRGYYEDGAYIARPLPEDEEGEFDPDEDDEANATSSSPAAIHSAYFRAILAQYSSLRVVLHAEPPSNALSLIPPQAQTDVRALTLGSTIATWGRLVRNTDPHPLQLALMSKDSVLRVLRIIVGGKFLRCGRNITERTSRWLWALLARLPERGQLDHTEISWIRELGRRAVLLGTSLTEMAKLRAELDSGGLGVHEGFDMSDTESDFGMYDDAEAVGEFVKPPPKKNDAGPLEAVPTYQVGSGIVLQDTSPVAGEGSILAPKVGSKDVEKVINRPGDMHENAIAAGPKGESPDPNHEDGEISDDDGDMPMDIASNASSQSDNEGGDGREVDIEDAKAKLLARVEAAAAEDERLTAKEEHELRLRMNMRATVTMILTVAGEAYGQRDLLEFRDPFVGI